MRKYDFYGQNDELRFCTTHMKGWRENMEDEYISEMNIGNGNSLFCVFDGHGGSEASKFVKEHL